LIVKTLRLGDAEVSRSERRRRLNLKNDKYINITYLLNLTKYRNTIQYNTMKKNKTICLDSEVMDRLATEENASGLIERLLRSYFSMKDVETMTKEEIKKRIALIELQKKHKAELEAINGRD